MIINDFHRSLLWLRALEILTGSSLALVLEELQELDLFGRYRSPWRA